MDNMQNSTSIAKDTGMHPGDSSGGGSDGGEVDDSNNDSVYYQYKETEESPTPESPDMKPDETIDPKPPDPGKPSHLKRDDPSMGNGVEKPSDSSTVKSITSDDKVHYQ